MPTWPPLPGSPTVEPCWLEHAATDTAANRLAANTLRMSFIAMTSTEGVALLCPRPRRGVRCTFAGPMYKSRAKFGSLRRRTEFLERKGRLHREFPSPFDSGALRLSDRPSD